MIFNLYLLGYWFNEYIGDESDIIKDALNLFDGLNQGTPEWIEPEFITYQKVY